MSPRTPRDESSLNLYNILICGNNNEAIFLDDEDKLTLISMMSEASRSASCDFFAYCILNSKANFLLSPRGDSLSSIMRRLNMSYAAYFNRKYARSGHVFHDRYRSLAINGADSILPVIHSIHAMPLDADPNADITKYPFSSYHDYVGLSESCKRISICGVTIYLTDILSGSRDYAPAESPVCFEEPESFARRLADEYLAENEISAQVLLEKGAVIYRRELVILLREKTGCSIRKISELLGINRGEVYKFITNNKEDEEK